MLLSQTRVCAGRTGLGTLEAGGDACRQLLLVDLRGVRVGRQHGGDMRHAADPSQSWKGPGRGLRPSSSSQVHDLELQQIGTGGDRLTLLAVLVPGVAS